MFHAFVALIASNRPYHATIGMHIRNAGADASDHMQGNRCCRKLQRLSFHSYWISITFKRLCDSNMPSHFYVHISVLAKNHLSFRSLRSIPSYCTSRSFPSLGHRTNIGFLLSHCRWGPWRSAAAAGRRFCLGLIDVGPLPGYWNPGGLSGDPEADATATDLTAALTG